MNGKQSSCWAISLSAMNITHLEVLYAFREFFKNFEIQSRIAVLVSSYSVEVNCILQ